MPINFYGTESEPHEPASESKPFFSVVLPVYNGGSTLGRALDSLMAQSFTNFETIVVDDGSTDGSAALALAHPLGQKRVLQNEQNRERCYTRNKGIAAANGEYICFLDADDYHLPNHLSTLFQKIKETNPKPDFVFVHAWDESMDGKRSERTCPPFYLDQALSYFMRYTVNPQRWAIRKEVVLHHAFDESIPICEDMDLCLRLVAAGCSMVQVPHRTTVYVAHPNSFTHGDPQKWERERDSLQRIFARQELRRLLPKNEKRRLESMCRFHFAQKAFQRGDRSKTLKEGLRSFFLYPKGYNGKTTPLLAVMIMYSLPLIGPIFPWAVGSIKRIRKSEWKQA
jgi:glycosyltransferase involved in cell wall biosynthesis